MVSSLALASIAVKGLKAFRVVVFTRVDFRFTNRSFNVTRFGNRVTMKVVCCFYLFFPSF